MFQNNYNQQNYTTPPLAFANDKCHGSCRNQILDHTDVTDEIIVRNIAQFK